MVNDYQAIITSLATKENTPSFKNLEGILLQEEEREKNVDNIFHNAVKL